MIRQGNRARWGLLDLRGAVAPIDAMGCQKTIARQMVEAGAVTCWRSRTTIPPWARRRNSDWISKWGRGRLTVTETMEKDHGRIKIRRYALNDRIDWLAAQPDGAGLQAVQ